MDINQLSEALTQQPQFQQVLQGVAEEFSDVSPEQVDELIKLIEFALQRPQQYDEIRAAAIRDDMVDPEDLPEQFDAKMLLAVLVVLKRLRQSAESGEGAQLAMRRGGLTRMRSLAARGRLGDTMLAHISPEEAAMLKAHGGAGTINPDTGLPQFFSWKKLFKAVLPIALNFIAPGLGSAIGAALGASGMAATMIGQAILGGLTSGLTGGNVLQGALMGGLGGGLGGAVGGSVSDALGLGLGATGQSVLGGALLGGAAGAATGQGFGKGALMGAAGAGLGAMTQGVGSGQLGSAVGTFGQAAGNMLTAGYTPKEALAGGALAGLMRGVTPEKGLTQRFSDAAGQQTTSPSDAVVENLKASAALPAPTVEGAVTVDPLTGQPVPTTPPVSDAYRLEGANTYPQEWYTQQGAPGTGGSPVNVAPAPFSLSNIMPNLSMKNLSALAMVGSALSKPPAAQQAVQGLSPQQQEYMNRPGIKWDWNKLQADANARNMSLSEFMATYWPQITSGNYVLPGSYVPPGQNAMPTAPTANMAAGGLNSMARLMRGGGSGRDDTISAKLSDGEYVMDAETVAMLGDGSTAAGAKKLDQMRAQLRKHKGKVMARGKFSPDAKSPLAYLKGA